MIPIDPCGRVVSVLRSCYSTGMNFSNVASNPQRIKWFFVDSSTPPLGFPTPFISRNWESDKTWPSVGEVAFDSRPWNAGVSPMPTFKKFGKPCGPAETWANGSASASPAGLLRNPNGTSLCCVGQLIGTVKIAWKPGYVLHRVPTPKVTIAWRPQGQVPVGPTIAWKPGYAGPVGPTIAWRPGFKLGLNVTIAWRPGYMPHPGGLASFCFDPLSLLLTQPPCPVTIAWRPGSMPHPGGTGSVCFDPMSVLLTQTPSPVTIAWRPGYMAHPGGDMAACFVPSSRLLVEPPGGPKIAWLPDCLLEPSVPSGTLELVPGVPTVTSAPWPGVSGTLDLIPGVPGVHEAYLFVLDTPGEIDLVPGTPTLTTGGGPIGPCKCLTFSNAGNSSVSIPSMGTVGPPHPWGASFWCNPTASTAVQEFFSWGDVSGYIEFVYNYPATGNVTLFISGEVVTTWSGPPAIGSWSHMLFGWDLTTSTTFVNGSLVASGVGNYVPQLIPRIGRSEAQNNYSFDGKLMDVRFYSASQAANIAAIYGSGCPTNDATLTGGALLGRWKLNDITGTTAPDSSGNGFDGTLVNGPTVTNDCPCP